MGNSWSQTKTEKQDGHLNFTWHTKQFYNHHQENKNLPGHLWVLQSFSTLSEPGQDPPYFSVTFLALVLYIFPPPQDLSQDEKSLHGPQMQGTVKDIMIEHEVHSVSFYKEQLYKEQYSIICMT